jgi:carbonic anhydrase
MLSFSIPTRVLHLFTLLLFAAAAFADEECPPRFSYCGYSGPAQWPNIKITGKTNECGGLRQSPIRIGTTSPTPGPLIKFEYKACNATIQNTGHDILVTPTGDAGTVKMGDLTVYKLVQFHLHYPSEHIIPGVAAQAELHIVHQPVTSTVNQFAVIAVMLTPGSDYPGTALKQVFANLPVKACTKLEARIEFNNLVPASSGSYYTYDGSLTTPPCTQSVSWFILSAGGHIESPDLNKLTALGTNARPIQNNDPPLRVTYVRPP